MAPSTSLALAVAVMAVLTVLAPLLARRLGRDLGYLLAAGFLAAVALLGVAAPDVLRGSPVAVGVSWVPSLGMRLELLLDGLSLLFALLVLVVGALVMAYSARYLKPGSHPRFYGHLTLFALSMLGLVLAGDLILLLVFWELTSITSFFLIGGGGSGAESKPAMRAFLVTALGGLALFAGVLLLGIATGGTNLQEVLAGGAALREHALAPAIMALVILGAFTKSAQVPFHFWLPGAMVAPTPVSTYLHAATMVKAGIYLLARFSPVFGGSPAWRSTLIITGLVTAVVGAGLALRQYDLKALLAYSTISHLGFIIALVGVGTFPALAAAGVHILAHGSYKAALFMVVGVIDHEAGSRDLRRLGGLRKMMPVTAAVTGLAALSMAGFPPLLGFVSKEEAFAAFLGAPGAAWLAPLAVVLALAAAVMTFAYGARIFDGAFEGPPLQRLYDPSPLLWLPAAVVAAAGLGFGVVVWVLNPLVGSMASAAVGDPGEVGLTLWHGFTPSLGLSALTILAGITAFLFRSRIDRLTAATLVPSGAGLFDHLYRDVQAVGRAAARPFRSPAPARHLAWILGAAATAGLGAWFVRGEVPAGPAPPSPAADWVVVGLLAAAALAAARTRTRIAAVALLGIVGFLVAFLFVLFGAPDLAITQLLIETLTVALVVLVFRRLPLRFRPVAAARRAIAAGMAVGVGVLAAGATFALTGRRPASEAAGYFLEAAPREAGGNNVVNTILVDFRALDTLGEITVLAVAAIGVLAVVGLRQRGDGADDPGSGGDVP